MKYRRSCNIAFLIAFIHCVIGNLIGIYGIENSVLEFLFLPYVFIAGLSQFAGWHMLSYSLTFLFLIVITLLLWPIVALIVKTRNTQKEDKNGQVNKE